MGIYDRSYYRDEPRRGGYGHWSAVITLIVINSAVFVANMFSPNGDWLMNHMALPANLFSHPWEFWKLLSYGFAHAPMSIQHILFNMYGLWLFGRDVEVIYGREAFYRVYISLIILSGLGWVILANVLHESGTAAYGASGAVMGITIIYVMHFPNRELLFMFFLPMPMWVAGMIFIGMDLWGVMGGGSVLAGHVANTAHLTGAFFGYIFYEYKWTLFSLLPSGRWLKSLFGPRLRVHREPPDSPRDEPQREDMQQRVDQILAKISREGEASLTAEERRTLEEASRKLRNRRG